MELTVFNANSIWFHFFETMHTQFYIDETCVLFFLHKFFTMR
jgi:hypothetical protein